MYLSSADSVSFHLFAVCRKSSKIRAAKKRSKFEDESSSSEEEPSHLAAKAKAKPTKLPPLKKGESISLAASEGSSGLIMRCLSCRCSAARVVDSDSSSSPAAEHRPAPGGKGAKGKAKAAPKPSAMDVDGSGSATE